LGYELVCADTDSVFIIGQTATTTTGRTDYDKVVDILSKETRLSLSIEYYYKFLVLLLESNTTPMDTLTAMTD
jgi:hypothetical protein